MNSVIYASLPHAMKNLHRLRTACWAVYFFFSSACSTRLPTWVKKKKARVVIPSVYNRMMTRIIKPDVVPGEFKCRTCYAMWSSYMENHILHRYNGEIRTTQLRFYETHNLNIWENYVLLPWTRTWERRLNKYSQFLHMPIQIQSQENEEYITKSTIIVPRVESNILKVS